MALLYGTTDDGGANGDGAVFSITTSRAEKVLYSFKGGAGDGAGPAAGLISVNGTLYGTTSGGGAPGNGTVFAISTSGKERVLYSFGDSGDGESPYAGLVNVNGTLYGTTLQGGANDEGTVFSITTSGMERVLHSFNVTDGWYPTAGLISVKGTLARPMRGAPISATELSSRSRRLARKPCSIALRVARGTATSQ